MTFSIPGVRLAACTAGIKRKDRSDIALFEICEGATVAATFTNNAFAAAPILLSKKHISESTPRYLIVNSGNANAGTGEQGYEDAATICTKIATHNDVDTTCVLPFSTGVIGERLPTEKILAIVPELHERLSATAWEDAAGAIMTTDTVPKLTSRQFEIDGQTYAITGISKGSGMIKPNMATMLSFIATNAPIEQQSLSNLLDSAVKRSFNRITVDGDTSTNDACVLIATGCQALGADTQAEIVRSNHPLITAAHNQWDELQGIVFEVAEELAKKIVRDGEGATKFVEVTVASDSEVDSEIIAFTVAESPLVKTALFASDPNWGRILAAVGRAKVAKLPFDTVGIWLDDYQIVANGSVVLDYEESTAASVMSKPEFTIRIKLGRANRTATVWTCDLSYDYVKINAEYRS